MATKRKSTKKTQSRKTAAKREAAGGLPTDPSHPLYSPLTADGNKPR